MDQVIKNNATYIKSPLWKILTKPLRINDKAKYIYIEYEDINSSLQLQTKDSHDIIVSDLSSYVLGADSWLQINLNIVQKDGANVGEPFPTGSNIALVSSAMTIFNRVELIIDSTTVHSYREVATIQNIMALSLWSKSFEETNGLLMGVNHSSGDFQADRSSNPGFKARAELTDFERQATYLINLGELFPYLAQNMTVLKGARITIRLFRNSNDNTIFHKALGLPDGKIILNKLSCWWATITPSPSESLRLEKLLTSNKVVVHDYIEFQLQKSSSFVANTSNVEFSWSIVNGMPKWVFIMFVLDQDEQSQEDDNMAYPNLDVSQLSVELNSVIHPQTPLRMNFSDGIQDDSAQAYLHFLHSRDDILDTTYGSILDYITWKTNYRIFYIPLIALDNDNIINQNYTIKIISQLSPSAISSFQVWILTGNLVTVLAQGLGNRINIQR